MSTISQTSESPIVELPMEISMDIFQRLDDKSLMSATATCCALWRVGNEIQEQRKERVVKSFADELAQGAKPFKTFYQKEITAFVPEYASETILKNNCSIQKTRKAIDDLKAKIVCTNVCFNRTFQSICVLDEQTIQTKVQPHLGALTPPVNSQWLFLAFFTKEHPDGVPFVTASGYPTTLHSAFSVPVIFPRKLFHEKPEEILVPLYGRIIKIIPSETFYNQLSNRENSLSNGKCAGTHIYYIMERDATEASLLKKLKINE